MIVYEGLCLYFPILLQQVTEVAEKEFTKGDPSVMPLVLKGIEVLAFIIAIFGVYFLSEWVGATCTNIYAGNIRSALYEKFSHLSSSQIDQIGVARILPTLMADTNWLKKYHRRKIILVVYFPVAIIGSFVMLYIQSWIYLVFALSSIPFLAVFAVLYFKKFSKTIPASVNAYDEYFLNVKEGIKGAKDIRILGKADERAKDFEEQVRHQRRQYYSFDKGVALSNAFHTILFTIITVIIIIFAALFNLTPEQTSEIVVLNTAIQYINKIWTSSHQIFQWFLDVLPRARFTKKRLDKFYAMPEPVRGGGLKEIPTYKTNILKLKDVEFKYSNGNKILNCVNIDIENGKLVSIVGAVNSGKSVIANMITKLKSPTAGSVTFNGIDITQINSNYWRKSFISFCDSSPLFLPGTIRDNMKTLAPTVTDEQILSVFKDIGVQKFVNQYENFLDMKIRDGFSEGNRNLINVARAIIKPAHIYVFNQCFEHIQNDVVVKILAKMRREKKTAVFISYNGVVFKGSDLIYIIKDGNISGTGTHESLLKTNKDYRDFYGSMLGTMIDDANTEVLTAPVEDKNENASEGGIL
jgi:ATP-binding cassette subfamily B protein